MKNLGTVWNLIRAAASCIVLVLFAMTFVMPNLAQQTPKYPIMEKVAAKVIEKYQKTSCEDLKKEKAQPPSGQDAAMAQKAVEELKKNPDMRKAFLDKVAPPIANKMFECGMIP